jgi:hypothetical protein
MGPSLLFIYKKHAPLYIETMENKIFINSKSAHKIKDWYDHLKEKED